MAKAIWDKIPLHICLNKLVLKYLLGNHSECELEDLKCFDTPQYNSLKFINENDIN